MDRFLGDLAYLIIYYPLIMLAVVFRPFGAFLHWYGHLWGAVGHESDDRQAG